MNNSIDYNSYINSQEYYNDQYRYHGLFKRTIPEIKIFKDLKSSMKLTTTKYSHVVTTLLKQMQRYERYEVYNKFFNNCIYDLVKEFTTTKEYLELLDLVTAYKLLSMCSVNILKPVVLDAIRLSVDYLDPHYKKQFINDMKLLFMYNPNIMEFISNNDRELLLEIQKQ